MPVRCFLKLEDIYQFTVNGLPDRAALLNELKLPNRPWAETIRDTQSGKLTVNLRTGTETLVPAIENTRRVQVDGVWYRVSCVPLQLTSKSKVDSVTCPSPSPSPSPVQRGLIYSEACKQSHAKTQAKGSDMETDKDTTPPGSVAASPTERPQEYSQESLTSDSTVQTMNDTLCQLLAMYRQEHEEHVHGLRDKIESLQLEVSKLKSRCAKTKDEFDEVRVTLHCRVLIGKKNALHFYFSC